MPVDPIPEEIARFLATNIDSFAQLEVLRVLGDDPSKEWAAAELSREVQARPAALASHLAVLQSRGLLTTVTRGADLFCRHGPDTPERERLVSRLLGLYRERPVTLIKMVYAQAGKRRGGW
jgi:hypothetical protein